MSINWLELEKKQREAESKGWLCVTGAVIFSSEGKAFVQKRSEKKLLFPGGWDIVGGHVEPGESLLKSLEREVEEETGWKVKEVTHLVKELDWNSEKNGETVYRREFDFIVTVEGDLNNPQIEEENFSEYRWITKDQLPLLSENKAINDGYIRSIIEAAFSLWN